MTLAQLQSFVLVARLGSVKAAAAELEVTEPAVSVAVAALRKELGDELFVREGRGIALTPGGRRLAALASEIVGLAEQARRSVQESESRRLQVVATSVVAEHVGPLIDAFTARDEGLEIAVETAPGASFAELLERRRADVALGPHPGVGHTSTIASAPFLRCRLIVVAAPDHPLAGTPGLAPSALAGQRWLVGDPELDPTTATGLYLARMGLSPSVSTFSSHAGAIAAAAAGEGVALTLAHSVVDEVRRRSLVRLDVHGTPVLELWHASTLGLGRALPAALAFQRFATTPDATQAIAAGRAGAVSTRVRPKKVHVTLWQSVAEERARELRH
jgi:LysR family transcriptional regulator, low CO2-responsive transcriptional regulator